MKARFTERARSDLLGIEAYLHEQNPAAAKETLQAISDSIAFLCEFPLAAPLLSPDGVRKHNVARTRYMLLYLAEGAQLNILRVLHAAQSRSRY